LRVRTTRTCCPSQIRILGPETRRVRVPNRSDSAVRDNSRVFGGRLYLHSAWATFSCSGIAARLRAPNAANTPCAVLTASVRSIPRGAEQASCMIANHAASARGGPTTIRRGKRCQLITNEYYIGNSFSHHRSSKVKASRSFVSVRRNAAATYGCLRFCPRAFGFSANVIQVGA
jgi:hypothetical protein